MNLRTAKIISLSLTMLGVFVALQGATFSWFTNHQGYAPAQPINFSHRVHAGDNQIPCLYCHSAAEQSKVAGVPAASTALVSVHSDCADVSVGRAERLGEPLPGLDGADPGASFRLEEREAAIADCQPPAAIAGMDRNVSGGSVAALDL